MRFTYSRLELGDKAEATVEEVFERSGFDAQEIRDIESFYDKLRRDVAAGRVVEAERDATAGGLPIIRLRQQT